MERDEYQSVTFEDVSNIEFQQRLLNEEDQMARTSVLSRLRRILNYTATGHGCEEEDRDGSECQVRDLLRAFMNWKESAEKQNNNRRRGGSIEQLVIYGIAKLCYWSWVQDSTLVGNILVCIYDCDAHFSGLFLHAIDRTEQQFTLWRWTSNSSDLKEHTILLYFVHHAQNAHIQFNGVRFIDLDLVFPMRVPPAILAAVYAKPRPLAVLLKYGALLKSATVYREQMNDFGSDWDVPLLLRHLLRILWACLGSDLEYFDSASTLVSTTMQNVCSCLRLLLRVIPQVEFISLDFPLLTFERGLLMRTTPSRDFIKRISERGIVPSLACRYLEPSELQHLCRCSIRRALNTNWSLPHGIFKLPLPYLLQSYLNLHED